MDNPYFSMVPVWRQIDCKTYLIYIDVFFETKINYQIINMKNPKDLITNIAGAVSALVGIISAYIQVNAVRHAYQ